MLILAVSRDDLRVAQKAIEHYRGLRLDLADAVNVVLAERYLTNEILTLDEKDFRAIRPLTPAHHSFRLLLQD